MMSNIQSISHHAKAGPLRVLSPRLGMHGDVSQKKLYFGQNTWLEISSTPTPPGNSRNRGIAVALAGFAGGLALLGGLWLGTLRYEPHVAPVASPTPSPDGSIPENLEGIWLSGISPDFLIGVDPHIKVKSFSKSSHEAVYRVVVSTKYNQSVYQEFRLVLRWYGPATAAIVQVPERLQRSLIALHADGRVTLQSLDEHESLIQSSIFAALRDLMNIESLDVQFEGGQPSPEVPPPGSIQALDSSRLDV